MRGTKSKEKISKATQSMQDKTSSIDRTNKFSKNFQMQLLSIKTHRRTFDLMNYRNSLARKVFMLHRVGNFSFFFLFFEKNLVGPQALSNTFLFLCLKRTNLSCDAVSPAHPRRIAQWQGLAKNHCY